MMDDFERAHSFTAVSEGGYVFNPKDTGGETNLGVTRRVWEAWCRGRGLPVKPMRLLTPSDVAPLYRACYWAPLAATLPWPLSAAIYDMSVNHGVGDTDAFDEDGDEAGATWMLWKATQLCPSGTPLQRALAACDAREGFYRGIVARRPDQVEFMRGWMRRVNAQRGWLRDNALPTVPRVFLRDKNGRNVAWDGKATIYAGQPVDAAWVAQMQTVYPAGSHATLGALVLTVAPDGALLLERA
jgi:lysozyme family protein